MYGTNLKPKWAYNVDDKLLLKVKKMTDDRLKRLQESKIQPKNKTVWWGLFTEHLTIEVFKGFYNIIPASNDLEHFDFILVHNGKTYKVDVKTSLRMPAYKILKAKADFFVYTWYNTHSKMLEVYGYSWTKELIENIHTFHYDLVLDKRNNQYKRVVIPERFVK